jgi:hypothetical protein
MYTTAFPIETNLVLIKIGLLYEISTLHKQPNIIDKRTQLMWFGFNFSDAKTTQQLSIKPFETK